LAEPPSERDYSRILELLRKREGEVVWLVIRSPKGSSRGAHWLLGKVSEGEADKLFVAARRYRSAWVIIAVDDIIHGAEFDPRIKTALRTIAFLVLPCALVTGLVIWPPLRLGLAVPLTIAGIWVLAKSTSWVRHLCWFGAARRCCAPCALEREGRLEPDI